MLKNYDIGFESILFLKNFRSSFYEANQPLHERRRTRPDVRQSRRQPQRRRLGDVDVLLRRLSEILLLLRRRSPLKL